MFGRNQSVQADFLVCRLPHPRPTGGVSHSPPPKPSASPFHMQCLADSLCLSTPVSAFNMQWIEISLYPRPSGLIAYVVDAGLCTVSNTFLNLNVLDLVSNLFNSFFGFRFLNLVSIFFDLLSECRKARCNGIFIDAELCINALRTNAVLRPLMWCCSMICQK